jgi:hypothetical protein
MAPYLPPPAAGFVARLAVTTPLRVVRLGEFRVFICPHCAKK